MYCLSSRFKDFTKRVIGDWEGVAEESWWAWWCYPNNQKLEVWDREIKERKSSVDKTNKDLRKLLEVERKRCEDSETNVVDVGTQVEGLKSQVKGLEYEVVQLKSEKVSLQGEIDYLKKGVVEASVGFAVDFFTFFVEAISHVKVKAP